MAQFRLTLWLTVLRVICNAWAQPCTDGDKCGEDDNVLPQHGRALLQMRSSSILLEPGGIEGDDSLSSPDNQAQTQLGHLDSDDNHDGRTDSSSFAVGGQTMPQLATASRVVANNGVMSLGADSDYSTQMAKTCIPVLPSGLEHESLVWHLGQEHQKRLFLDTTSVIDVTRIDGGSAPLDASGFKDITSLCCPMQMEMFFGRLLDLKGCKACSKPHIQGLMHWFSCVPDMDFAYVISVVENGNPCKYWAPEGETCQPLSCECEGKHCGGSCTTTTTTTTTNTGLCDPNQASSFDFDAATVQHSNLGGMGPGTGVQDLRISGAGTSETGESYDLVVTALDHYEAENTGNNGVVDGFGSINIKQGSPTYSGATTFKFSFMQPGTDTPLTLSEIHMTLLDIDGGSTGARERLVANGFTDYIMGDAPTIGVTTLADGSTAFEAPNTRLDVLNPTDANALTEAQRGASVMLIYKNKASFELNFGQLGWCAGNDPRCTGASFAECQALVDTGASCTWDTNAGFWGRNCLFTFESSFNDQC